MTPRRRERSTGSPRREHDTATAIGGEFQDTLDDVRRLFDQARTATVEDPPVEAGSVDDRVRMTMQADGDLTGLTVDPQLLRDGLETLLAYADGAWDPMA
jgi:DNA-binding protein YbaB